MFVRLRLVTVAAMILAVVPAVAAHAQSEGEGSGEDPVATHTMEVVVGLEGYAHPDEPVPVVVDLTSEELIVGRLDVNAGGQTVRTQIEVPANSAKQYVIYGAPPRSRSQVSVSLVRVVDGEDDVIERQTTRVVAPTDELLVGVLGADTLLTPLRSASATPLQTEIVPVPVAGPSLSRGGGPLAYLVVDAAAMAELDDETVAALSSWVRIGGRVIGTPAALEPLSAVGVGDVLDRTPAAVTRFGQGELIAVADPLDLTVDEWGSVVRNTPPLGLIRRDTGFVASADSLVAAATAGREASVPALPWLLGGIALFIVLVGPVNFLLLRRMGRPEWAWITVPALSALFVAAFWVVGRSSVQAFTVTTASVVVDDGVRPSASTALVLQIERAGTHDVELPDGWDAGPAASGIGVESGVAQIAEDGAVSYRFELEDLGVGAAEATWAPDPVAVDLDITSDGRLLQVTASNGTDRDFWAWGIVIDGVAAASADPLPIGESGVVSVRTSGIGGYSYEPVISGAVQRRLFYVDDFDSSDSSVVAGLAGRAQAEVPTLDRRGVFFFGFADDEPTRISVDGVGGDTVGTTLMLKESTFDPSILAGQGEVKPSILSISGASTAEDWGDGRIWAYGAEEMVFGYVVPEGVSSRLVVEPGGTQFEEVDAFDWGSGEFEAVQWGDDLSSYVSAGGEVVLRARPSDSRFFDEGVLLSRYAISWEVGG